MPEPENKFTGTLSPLKCESVLATIFSTTEPSLTSRFYIFILNGELKCQAKAPAKDSCTIIGTVTQRELYDGLTPARWCQLGKKLAAALVKNQIT